MNKGERKWRPISEEERALVAAILKENVAGSAQLNSQLRNCLIFPKFEDNAVWGFRISESEPKADVPYELQVAAEARALDTDGVEMEVLIHVRGGNLYELEFVKTDGSKLSKFPEASDLFDFQTYWHTNQQPS